MLQEAQVRAAAKALLLYLERNQDDNQLLDEEAYVSLAFTLKKIPEKARVKPWRVPLQHSLYADRPICLITKDPQKDFKDKLAEEPIDGVEKVIGLTKLRRNYKQFKDRRQLLATYDLFLADDRVLPMLPAMLGVKFFEKKKQPLPVCLKGKSFKAEVERARDGTSFFLPAGATCMVKVGRSSFSSEQLVENIMTAIEAIVERIPRKWKNIQAVYLRSHDSPALPIFASLPVVQRIEIGAARPPPKAAVGAKGNSAPQKRKRALAEKKTSPDAPSSAKKAKPTAAGSAKKAKTNGVNKTKTPLKKTTLKKKAPQSAMKALTPKGKAPVKKV